MVGKVGSPPLILSRALNFSAHPASEHQPDHFVIADERPQRILKRGRLILLDKEVANPRRAITRDQSEREKPPPANDDKQHHTADRDCGADEVK